jgi:hypothetical protein
MVRYQGMLLEQQRMRAMATPTFRTWVLENYRTKDPFQVSLESFNDMTHYECVMELLKEANL